MNAAPSDDDQTVTRIVSEAEAGERVDVLLAAMFDSVSRAQVRRTIEANGVTVNHRPCKPSTRVHAGDALRIRFCAYQREMPAAEAIPVEILYEDDELAVINKPGGMVVHPGKGRWQGTLVSALAHHFQRLSSAAGPARPGIVHRLDRDTSGVIVIAKSDRSHERIANQFKARTVAKTYLAIVTGLPDRDSDWIDRSIGHHPHHRERMAIRSGHVTSRDARTFYKVLERFRAHALLRVEPKTGRTHQIRLHLMSIGCPVLCDRLYGGRSQITRLDLLQSADLSSVERSHAASDSPLTAPILTRQALHASELSFDHPISGERLTLRAPFPQDLQAVVTMLRGGK